MTHLFENPWLLLTLAAVAIVPAAITRQVKPEWGYCPLLIPLLIAAVGFGLDFAVQTDTEQIHALVRHCRNAVIKEDISRLGEAFCEDYDDGYHRNKAELLASAERAIKGASVKKVRFSRIELNRQERRAKMDMDTVVHLNADSRYAGFGSVVFVSLRLEFAKRPSGPWCIRRAGVISINNQPIKWGAVR